MMKDSVMRSLEGVTHFLIYLIQYQTTLFNPSTANHLQRTQSTHTILEKLTGQDKMVPCQRQQIHTSVQGDNYQQNKMKHLMLRYGSNK